MKTNLLTVVIVSAVLIACKKKSLETHASGLTGYSTSELRSEAAIWDKTKKAVCTLEKAGWKKIPSNYLPRWEGRTLTHGQMVQALACFANFESTLGASRFGPDNGDGMGQPLGMWQVREGHLSGTCRNLSYDKQRYKSVRDALTYDDDFNAKCSLLVFMARPPGTGFDPWVNFCSPSDAVLLKSDNKTYVFPQSCDDCDAEKVWTRVTKISDTRLQVKISVPNTCSANEAVVRRLKVTGDKVETGSADIGSFSATENKLRVAYIDIPLVSLANYTNIRITVKNKGTEFFRTNPSPSILKYLSENANSGLQSHPGDVVEPVLPEHVDRKDGLSEPQQKSDEDYFGNEFQ